jgi:hypothetical protein
LPRIFAGSVGARKRATGSKSRMIKNSWNGSNKLIADLKSPVVKCEGFSLQSVTRSVAVILSLDDGDGNARLF